MILRAENLVKEYKGRRVVNEVSVNINQGEIVGLLGPNGAGKTTSFYQIVGFIKPDSGKVFWMISILPICLCTKGRKRELDICLKRFRFLENLQWRII